MGTPLSISALGVVMYRGIRSFGARLLLGAFLVSAGSSAAQAEEVSPNYIGGGAAVFDNEDRYNGFGGFTGYQFTRNIAVEAGFFQGEDDTIGDTKDTTLVYLTGIGRYPFTEQFALTWRIGMYQWSQDLCTADSAAQCEIDANIEDDSGFAPLYGVGLDLDFIGNFRWQVMHTRYVESQIGEIDAFSVRLAYLF